MPSPDLATYIWLCLSALLAGAINAIAGGGTLLTFPALFTIMPGDSVLANGTSTTALVPGSASGAWGYRQEFALVRGWAPLLGPPSFLGGLVGTLLVTRLEERFFNALVPWLILTAAVLFLLQPTLARWTLSSKEQTPASPRVRALVVVAQFVIAVYGGYFGAGIGILMLSSLSFLGIGDINRLNALKTFLAVCINGASVSVFAWDEKIAWAPALSMAVAAIIGGYLGARAARRLPRAAVRWTVIVIGFGLAGYYFLR